MRRVLALFVSLTGIALASSPARAFEDPQFETCSISDVAGAAPIELFRTRDRNRPFLFQSTPDLGVIAERKPLLQAFLARNRGDKSPELWIVQNHWADSEIMLPNARLVGRRVGEGREEEAVFEAAADKGSFNIAKIDPRRLLDAFPDEAVLTIGFRETGKSGEFGGRLLNKSTLDLARLRSLLAWEAALSTAYESGRLGCSATHEKLPEAVDPAAYSACHVDLTDGGHISLDWDRGYVGIWWQLRLTPYMYLNARENFRPEQRSELVRLMNGGNESRFVGVMPRFAVYPDSYQLVAREGLGRENQLRLRVHFSMGSLTEEWPIANANNGLRPAQMAPFLPQGKDLVVEILSPEGKVLDRGVLPAGSLSAADERIRDGLARLQEMLADPIRHCAPPQPIVVT